MAGANVTIAEFTSATTAPVAGDYFAGYQVTASQTVKFTATQVAAYVFSTDVALTNQTTATSGTAGAADALASSPLGYLVISVNGTSVKLPYYDV